MSHEKRIQRLGRDFTAATAQRACFAKKKFRSRNAARDFNTYVGKCIPDRAPQIPYRCRVCGDWHLTSLDKQASANARRRNWNSTQ